MRGGGRLIAAAPGTERVVRILGNGMTEGTSALVKFGLGAQKGRFSWNGGFNWMDGATYSDAFGGQMSLQYAW